MVNNTIKTIVVFAAVAIMTLGAAAAQTWQSGDCTVTLENGVMTVSGTGAMADYHWGNTSPTVPWWDSHEQVSSIVVEEGVTKVGSYSFNSFSEATIVTLPNSLTTIGNFAFTHCSRLTSVTMPNSLTTMEEHAFAYCDGLTSITLPNSLMSLELAVFAYCIGLTTITLPNTLATIGNGSFLGCTGLTTITIPGTLTSIDVAAFYECTSMTDVYILADPANLTWINELFNGTVFDDFKADGSTQCHVPAKWISAYQQNFSHINVTFVGDLASTYILSDIPAGWTVTADGQPVEVNANGEAVIEEGASVVVTPSDRDNPRVKSVSIVPNN